MALTQDRECSLQTQKCFSQGRRELEKPALAAASSETLASDQNVALAGLTIGVTWVRLVHGRERSEFRCKREEV